MLWHDCAPHCMHPTDACHEDITLRPQNFWIFVILWWIRIHPFEPISSPRSAKYYLLALLGLLGLAHPPRLISNSPSRATKGGHLPPMVHRRRSHHTECLLSTAAVAGSLPRLPVVSHEQLFKTTYSQPWNFLINFWSLLDVMNWDLAKKCPTGTKEFWYCEITNFLSRSRYSSDKKLSGCMDWMAMRLVKLNIFEGKSSSIGCLSILIGLE